MSDLAIYGISAATLILLIVQFAKSTGLDTRYAAPLAVGLGLLLATLLKLDQPDIARWLQIELQGLLAGLAAAGFYSGQKSVRGN